MPILRRSISNTGGKSGEGSFVLTLPKDWVQEHNFQPKDELELLVDMIAPGSILLRSPQTDNALEGNDLIIDDNNHETNAARRRAVLGAYLEGYTNIKVINIPKNTKTRIEIRRDLQTLSNKLEGCSFNDRSRSEKLFELDIVSELASPLTILKELFNTTKPMLEDVFIAYIEFDQILAEDLIQRDDTADKLYFSMVRTLKLILRQPYKIASDSFNLVDTPDYRMLSSNLENLCDAVEHVAEALLDENIDDAINKEYINELTKAQKKRIIAIGDILIEGLDDAFEYYLANDEKQAVRLAARKPEMDKYKLELQNMRIHQSLIDVVDEAVETIVDLLELVHSNADDLDTS